jgi:SH3-like domain-containing protein
MRLKFIGFILIPLLGILTGQTLMQDEAGLILPETVMIEVGETREIEIMATCPRLNCERIVAQIEYNPRIISVDNVEVGNFLGENVIAKPNSNSIDPEEGIIYINLLSDNPDRPLIATDTAFVITVTRQISGETDFTFETAMVGGSIQPTDERIRLIEASYLGTITPTPSPLTVTLTRQANAYREPSTTSEAVATLEAGVLLPLIGSTEDGRWLLITLPEGDSGWLEASVFMVISDAENLPIVTVIPSPIPTVTSLPSATFAPTLTPTLTPSITPTFTATPYIPIPFAFVISKQAINLRSGPGMNYSVSQQARFGDGFIILSETVISGWAWYEIRINNSTSAWVREDLIDYRYLSEDGTRFITLTPTIR